MKTHVFLIASALTAGLVAYVVVSFLTSQINSGDTVVVGDEVLLPLPSKITRLTVEEAILLRKSIREWRREPITIVQLSMLLWASQGIVEDAGFGWYRRAAPSAGATYPVEVYVVVGEKGVRVGEEEFLKAGVYKYDYMKHSVRLVKEGDVRVDLWRASLRQDWVRDAPITIVLCAIYERTTGRYGERGIRYVHMELGHVGQNIYLVATALDLGTVAIGAFYDEEVAKVISSARNERPLYLFPVGVPREPHRATFEELSRLYERLRRGSRATDLEPRGDYESEIRIHLAPDS
ncbi:MAG: SagB/ThcOx family dehydrogenase [Sulfolobales archaeon]|nr:SagB/ThcOx family dehydrogenase [Sulfolobales archaeon]MCX8208559.1 SagB/ThcOx family dehydrogenase [Sulfolobales archaeon]MDW8010169.1 SagB/ThcOx family dehydrogenase [Sulfolobales archaeon]